MATARVPMKKPAPELRQDPRYERVLKKGLKANRLRMAQREMVDRLLSGEMDPRMMRCCGTGCRPCARDYIGATRHVLIELAKEPTPGLRGRLPSLGIRRRLKGRLRSLLGGDSE